MAWSSDPDKNKEMGGSMCNGEDMCHSVRHIGLPG